MELKPCPFCGSNRSQVNLTRYKPNGKDAFNVTCLTRDCHGAIYSLAVGLFDTRQAAITAWNTREENIG